MRTPLRFPALLGAFAVMALALPVDLAAQTDPVAGAWTLDWEGPRGTQTLTFDLTREADVLGGTVTMAMMNREMEMDVEGTVDGATVVLTFEFAGPGGGRAGGGRGGGGGAPPRGGGAMGAPTFRFEGTLVDGELRGTLATPRGDPVDAVMKRPATR